MNGHDQWRLLETVRPPTVDAIARLAKRQLTTAQLVELLGLLELELITRSTPPSDCLVDERPQATRRATGQ